MEDSKMEKINPAMLTTEGLLKIQEPSECFFCKLPFTSDDFKLDRISPLTIKNEVTGDYQITGHTSCIDKAFDSLTKEYGIQCPAKS